MFGLFKDEYEKFIDEVKFDCSFSLPYAVSVTDALSADLIKMHRSSMFKTISEMDNLNINFLEYYKGRVEFKLDAAKYLLLMASILSICNIRSKNEKWNPIDVNFVKKASASYWRDLHKNPEKFEKLYENVFLTLHKYSEQLTSELFLNQIDSMTEISNVAPNFSNSTKI